MSTSRARTFRAAARSSRRARTSGRRTTTGRGSLRVRARWKIEELARGQWQLVVNELPPGTSAQKVLEEIEEITNPKVKAGKKSLSPEQMREKQLVLAMLDTVRDESDRAHPVRLVFEPRTSKIDQDGVRQSPARQTSMESNVADQPGDGRAATAGRTGKNLRDVSRSGSSSASPRSRGARSTGWRRCSTASTCSKGA